MQGVDIGGAWWEKSDRTEYFLTPAWPLVSYNSRAESSNGCPDVPKFRLWRAKGGHKMVNFTEELERVREHWITQSRQGRGSVVLSPFYKAIVQGWVLSVAYAIANSLS